MTRWAVRPLRGRDPLGLRRALADRLLPLLVAAMALLAALAVGGAQGAGALAERWRAAAASSVTLHLPRGADAAAALTRLRALPEVERAGEVEAERLRGLLAPWLGDSPSLPLPVLIEVRPRDAAADPEGFAQRVASAVPGARAEAHGGWVARVVRLADGMRALAWGVLLLVTSVAAAAVAVATRAGIAARRETMLILHELGAQEADIAGRFARRLGWLCALGGALGAVAAVPALWLLAQGAVPLLGGREAGWDDLPWGPLLLLAPAAWLMGYVTAQATVRRWLGRLP
jgi:cell division transport system permease protein